MGAAFLIAFAPLLLILVALMVLAGVLWWKALS